MWCNAIVRDKGFYVVSYLLYYFAVGSSNKPSCIVYITPDDVVGEVWLMHQELGINLELRDKAQTAHYINSCLMVPVKL